MTARRQQGSIHHGMYIKISRLAEIIGAAPAEIVAAAKVCGHQVVPGMIWFQKEVTTEFVEEVWLIQKMNASAAARRQAHEAKALSQNPPGPPGDRRPQAA
jgi:tRNA nucleotidyltransferase/poly(A) polymerase